MNAVMVLLLLVSPAIGSFLAVLVDRLPRGEDVLTRPSACRSCGAALRLRDLIPLVSYVVLRGRCAQCTQKIPIVVFTLEVGATVIGVLVVALAKSDAQMVLAACWLWCLLALIACDLHWFRLPDVLTGSLFILGVGLAIEDPSRAIWDALLAAFVGCVSFWVIRVGYRYIRAREGLGLGDVKLMAGLGAGLGLTALPLTVLLGGLGALLWVLMLAVFFKRPLHGTAALPFGAFLSGAGIVVWMGLFF